jgi:hypothetical protein
METVNLPASREVTRACCDAHRRSAFASRTAVSQPSLIHCFRNGLYTAATFCDRRGDCGRRCSTAMRAQVIEGLAGSVCRDRGRTQCARGRTAAPNRAAPAGTALHRAVDCTPARERAGCSDPVYAFSPCPYCRFNSVGWAERSVPTVRVSRRGRGAKSAPLPT